MSQPDTTTDCRGLKRKISDMNDIIDDENYGPPLCSFNVFKLVENHNSSQSALQRVFHQQQLSTLLVVEGKS